mmetsp:Transcript_137118/g.273504  ORF Transcript_137118/g.273504 Transcript_137118/m.273504 type:complete len:629 (+) Transcript_137118:93-1979(+)
MVASGGNGDWTVCNVPQRSSDIAELRLQLELATDIEDWRKADQIRARLRELKESEQQLSIRSSGYRSRSPRRCKPPEQVTKSSSKHVPNENPLAIEYNKLIKQHLQRSSVESARWLLAEMQYRGVRPTTVTYNEFLNFFAKCKDISEVLRVVEGMRRQGLKPNRVSASTILKALGERPARDHIDEVVKILNWVSSSEGVDEILLSSLAEATVRIGTHASKIYAVLRRELDNNDGEVWSAQTCGSLIRAHGHTKDIEGMWKQWNNMMAHGIRPTVVTTGCMVEQLVMNGQVAPAYNLVKSLEVGDFRDCVNAVVYYSLVKGYAFEKDPDKVWSVYEEMRQRGLQTSITTYNGLVGAFSECGLVDRVDTLFRQMRAEGISPSVCTWSRLAKGHCLRGEVHKAMEVMEEMRRTSGLKPDEIFYNTLLDACAERGMVDEGMQLICRMENEGLPASKYTLTILAKLLVRARRLDGALAKVEKLSNRHSLDISINIYTTLLAACSEPGEDHAAAARLAASLLRKKLSRGSKPDRRSFTTLIRRFVTDGTCKESLEAIRTVLGSIGSSKTLQALLDKQALQDALAARASSSGIEEARPLLEELDRATGGNFWFDLDAAVSRPQVSDDSARESTNQ